MLKYVSGVLVVLFIADAVKATAVKDDITQQACAALKDHLNGVCYAEGMDKLDCFRCEVSAKLYNAVCSKLTGAVETPCQESKAAAGRITNETCTKLKTKINGECDREGMNNIACLRCEILIRAYNGICSELAGAIEAPCQEQKKAKEDIPQQACTDFKNNANEMCYHAEMNSLECVGCAVFVKLYNKVCSELTGEIKAPCQEAETQLVKKEDVAEQACTALKDHLHGVCYNEGMNNNDCFRCQVSVKLYNGICSGLTGAIETPCPEAAHDTRMAGEAENCAETRSILSETCYRPDMTFIHCILCEREVERYNEECAELQGPLDKPCPL